MSEVLAPSSVGVKPRWPGILKWIAIFGGLTVLLLTLIRPIVNDPPQKGPAGSSFGTVGLGVAALADLADRFDYPYVRRVTPLDQADTFDRYPLSRESVLVVLETSLSEGAAADVEAFLAGGGQLVTSIDSTTHWTSGFTGIDKTFVRQPTDGNLADATVSMNTNPALASLKVKGSTSFDLSRAPGLNAVPLATRNDAVIAVSIPVGEGQLIALADSSMLTNDLLAEADNAAFALELLGNGSRPIVFAEEPHGFGASLTPTGLPSNVRWFLFGLLAATLLLMITKTKRNGPPELAHRELAPARSGYLLSLGATIDRANRFDRDRDRDRDGKRTKTPNPPATPDTAATPPATPATPMTNTTPSQN
jgi:hypothetical protein